MTQDELLTKCELYMITEERLAECEPFSCNNEDLDDFFTNQATVFHKHLLAKPYMFCLKDSPNTIVCAFTLSNDSIRITNKFNEESKTKFLEGTNLSEKNMRRYPAVLIGRLGTNRQFAGQGIGSAVMEFIKTWVLTTSNIGFRFIIVDAYNTPATIHYYQKNGFKFLIEDEKLEAKYMGIGVGRLPLNTRLMYFDLLDVNISDF